VQEKRTIEDSDSAQDQKLAAPIGEIGARLTPHGHARRAPYTSKDFDKLFQNLLVSGVGAQAPTKGKQFQGLPPLKLFP
jgi:hypothetical protein